MFVSSYSTYIQSNDSQKIAKQKVEKQDSTSKSFSSNLSKETQATTSRASSLPINYISKKQVLNTKQEIENQQNKEQYSTKETINKFSGQNTLINAKSAYEGNSKMFSLFKIPNVALKQTPSIDKTLPKEPKDIKELNMRHKMVNTYLSNDNYYKVTA